MTSPTKTIWTTSSATKILNESHPLLRKVNAYCLGVITGSIIAGEFVRLAVLRHLNDLATGNERGLRFDQKRALRVIKYFRKVLTLTHGEGVQAFELSQWEQFCVAVLYGWLGPDGFRRFRTAYIEIGKGNGKSPLAAGLGLYGLVGDDETAAEIYCCATKKEQAQKTIFSEAVLMVQNSRWLSQRLLLSRDTIAYPKTASFFRLISSDTQGIDGPRPHMYIADEVHEHPNAELIDKLSAGFKGRRQPLGLEITNSGDDKRTVCYAHHEYSLKVLKEITPDDAWFAFVCGLDPCAKCKAEGKEQPNDECDQCDDYRQPRVWAKANPNLGISITEKYLREQVKLAIGMPSKENIIRRLNFCQWTEGSERWLSIEKWDECGDDFTEDELRGQECYGGLDLSKLIDLSAFVLYFPIPLRVLAWFWVPKLRIMERAKKDRVPYDKWVKQRFIKATEGDVIDYDVIRADINALARKFNIREIGFDPYNATQITTQLRMDGLEMVQVTQGMLTLSPACKHLEKQIIGKEIRHNRNPVMRWCVSNVMMHYDAAENMKPDKERSTERIDGLSALVNAECRALANGDTGGSAYDTRGILTV